MPNLFCFFNYRVKSKTTPIIKKLLVTPEGCVYSNRSSFTELEETLLHINLDKVLIDKVTVTTSQPLRSALRCVPLTDSCFTFPLVLPQPKTHSLSASSMPDPSALPGGGPTYPFIQDNNIDIMLLTETWLRPAGDDAKIADLAPPGYSVLSFPRCAGGSGAKGGGIAFVIRDSLKPHVATSSSFPV